MNDQINANAAGGAIQPPKLTMLQVRGRLASLQCFLMDHRAALAVCQNALANDRESIGPEVAITLDNYIISQLCGEIEGLNEFIAALPDLDQPEKVRS
jgi:hypothetical protein